MAVLELGRQLVNELAGTEQTDMLSQWMAHYLTEQISAAKAARGTTRETLQANCAELILKLWAHRHALPSGRRPLESYEPAIQTLAQLCSDQPRHFNLHVIPDTKKLPEPAKSFLSIALTIDRAASTIIQHCLAESISQIPKKDRRWLKFIKSVESMHAADVTLIIRMESALDDLTAEKDSLTTFAIKKIELLRSNLDKLQEVAKPIRQHFDARIRYFEAKQKS